MISEPPSVLLHLLTYARKGVLKNTQRVGKCNGSLKSAHPCFVTASEENRNQRVDGEALGGRKVAGRGKGKVWRRGIDRETGKVEGCCLGAETREGATSRPWRDIFSLSCVRHLGRKQMGRKVKCIYQESGEHFCRNTQPSGESRGHGTLSVAPRGLPQILVTVPVSAGEEGNEVGTK